MVKAAKKSRRGMSHAMLAAALLQAVIFFSANDPAMGMFELAATIIFTSLWLTAAFMFHKAAART